MGLFAGLIEKVLAPPKAPVESGPRVGVPPTPVVRKPGEEPARDSRNDQGAAKAAETLGSHFADEPPAHVPPPPKGEAAEARPPTTGQTMAAGAPNPDPKPADLGAKTDPPAATAGPEMAGVELHNHLLGIVPVQAFIDHPKCGGGTGDKGTGSPVALLDAMVSACRKDPDYAGHYKEIKDDKGNVIDHELDPEKSKSNQGKQNAAAPENIALIEGAKQEIDEIRKKLGDKDKPPTEEEKKKLEADMNHLASEACRDALTATEKTPFDGAYSIRDTLIKTYIDPQEDEKGKKAVKPYTHFIEMTAKALSEDKVEYSEQSASINKLLKGNLPESVLAAAADKAAKETGGPRPEMRILAMMETGVLSGDAPSADSRFKENQEQLKQLILTRKDVMGVDVASPEKFSFVPKEGESSSKAQDNFNTTFKMLQTCSQEGGTVNEKDPVTGEMKVVRKPPVGRPLVLRPHVGEGYAEMPEGQEFHPDKGKRNEAGNESAHAEKAHGNIEALLSEVEEMAKGKDEKHKKVDGTPLYTGNPEVDGVSIRFGHATHTDPDQARRMAKLGIVAEVNLSSNFATGSVEQSPEARAKQKEEEFEDHSLLHLIATGAPVVLSTDAQAVMETSLSDEYVKAKRILKEFQSGISTMRLSEDQIVDLEKQSGMTIKRERLQAPHENEFIVGYNHLPDFEKLATGGKLTDEQKQAIEDKKASGDFFDPKKNIDEGFEKLIENAEKYKQSVDEGDKKDTRRNPIPPSEAAETAMAVLGVAGGDESNTKRKAEEELAAQQLSRQQAAAGDPARERSPR